MPRLQLPEALWAKLDSVLHELADGELDAMDEEDFEMALHLTGADAGPDADAVQKLMRRCLVEDGCVDCVKFLQRSRPPESPGKKSRRASGGGGGGGGGGRSTPRPPQHGGAGDDDHDDDDAPRASARRRRRRRDESPDGGSGAARFDVGDLVQYNSASLGGWANAVVGTVYSDGTLELLGDPGPGATRRQSELARLRVLKDGADPARVRARSSAPPHTPKRDRAQRRAEPADEEVREFPMESVELGEEVAAGATCKVRRGRIAVDGRELELAVKVYKWEDGVVQSGGGLERGVSMSFAATPRTSSGRQIDAETLAERAADARAKPRWLVDEEQTHCMLCGVSFAAVKRHHCRYCGWIVCADCRPPGQELAVDRWASSDTHEIKILEPGQTKRKAVCNSCLMHAPFEVEQRRQAANEAREFAECRRRVRMEAEVLQRCRHRNVVGVVGLCQRQPSLCLLLEWCPSGSLWHVMESERTDCRSDRQRAALTLVDPTRMGYALGAAEAIAHLHSGGGGGPPVAHCDIKSANFLVKDGQLKLADFGDVQTEGADGERPGGGAGREAEWSGGSPGGGEAVMQAARWMGSAMTGLTAAVQKEAAALQTGSAGGGWMGSAVAGLAAVTGLGAAAPEPEPEGAREGLVGTPEWMAPELLERTLPVAWFEPDRSGACPVDKTVPGLREAAASWRPDSAAEGSTPMQTRWAVEDLCRGDIYGLGVVLWEIYTAMNPGGDQSRGRLEHIRVVCVEGHRPHLPSDGDRRRRRRGEAGIEEEYEHWVRRCWSAVPEERPLAAEVRGGLGRVADRLAQRTAEDGSPVRHV